MIASKYIYTTPFKRRGQTEMSHQKNLQALSGVVVPPRKEFKRAHRVVKRIGSDVFRVTSGGTIDVLSSEFKQRIQTHGTLLVGRPDITGLMTFIKNNKSNNIELQSL